jgi:hypothetical protein
MINVEMQSRGLNDDQRQSKQHRQRNSVLLKRAYR